MRYSRTGLVAPTSIGNCVQYRTYHVPEDKWSLRELRGSESCARFTNGAAARDYLAHRKIYGVLYKFGTIR